MPLENIREIPSSVLLSSSSLFLKKISLILLIITRCTAATMFSYSEDRCSAQLIPDLRENPGALPSTQRTASTTLGAGQANLSGRISSLWGCCVCTEVWWREQKALAVFLSQWLCFPCSQLFPLLPSRQAGRRPISSSSAAMSL